MWKFFETHFETTEIPVIMSAIAAWMSVCCSAIALAASIVAFKYNKQRDKPQLATKIYAIPDNPSSTNGPKLLAVRVSNIGIVNAYISRLCFLTRLRKRWWSLLPFPAIPIQRSSQNNRFRANKDFPIALDTGKSVCFAIPVNQLMRECVQKSRRMCLFLEDGTVVRTRRCGKVIQRVLKSASSHSLPIHS